MYPIQIFYIHNLTIKLAKSPETNHLCHCTAAYTIQFPVCRLRSNFPLNHSPGNLVVCLKVCHVFSFCLSCVCDVYVCQNFHRPHLLHHLRLNLLPLPRHLLAVLLQCLINEIKSNIIIISRVELYKMGCMWKTWQSTCLCLWWFS